MFNGMEDPMKGSGGLIFICYEPARIEAAIADHADRRGITVDAAALALPVVALIDGLWLNAQIDPERLSPARARTAAVALLSRALGPIDG
jgi:hypothetical protein